MDLRQVDAKDGMQGGACIKRWGVERLGVVPGRRQRADRLRGRTPKPLQDGLDASITGRDLFLVGIKQFQRLGQGEDMFLPIIADQGSLNGLRRGATAPISVGGQHRRFTLAIDEGADDLHVGDTREISDDMVELQVHLHQRLLHVLNVRGGIVEQAFAVPEVGAQRGDFARWPEAATQQPVGDCREFRVRAITEGPKEAPYGTTQSTHHPRPAARSTARRRRSEERLR
ncbi:MAG TPA: hypothetical protein VD860_07195, partial [Azospirillum sp.]|nr:hypothetical protein [Azospirillum sp.]